MWPRRLSRKQEQGRAWEQAACRHLEEQGLTLVEANFTCKVGEIDLVMRHGEMLVFVEVRQRASRYYGGAAASITPAKQASIKRAAEVYLTRYRSLPPCRIDVVAIDAGQFNWIRNAFGP